MTYTSEGGGEISTTLGIFRLPAELRIQIYEECLRDTVTGHQSSHWDRTIAISRRLLCQPIIRVNRQLREEIIAWTHEPLCLVIPFRSQQGALTLSARLDWLHHVDLFAVQCLKGIELRIFVDRCSVCGGHTGDDIYVHLQGGPARVEMVKIGEGCPVKILHDRRRGYLARSFVRHINAIGDVSKLKVVELLKAMQEVGR